jgi:hypothetical protein
MMSAKLLLLPEVLGTDLPGPARLDLSRVSVLVNCGAAL